MGVQIKDPAFRELVDEDAELERLGTGFTFTEGPIWNPAGYLLFSDMPGDVRRRWDPEGGVREVANPSNKGNGMTIDNDGRLVVCEHVTSSVARIDPDGTGSGREVLATHYEGKELNSPNDVVVKSDGSLYFSDPTYGRMPGFGIEREQDLAFQGVYRIAPEGGDPQLVVDDFDQPNGLCFSVDESLLYINDTTRAHIRVFDVNADGTLSNSRVRARAPGRGLSRNGAGTGARGRVLPGGRGSGAGEAADLADGMKRAAGGMAWCAGAGGAPLFNHEEKQKTGRPPVSQDDIW